MNGCECESPISAATEFLKYGFGHQYYSSIRDRWSYLLDQRTGTWIYSTCSVHNLTCPMQRIQIEYSISKGRLVSVIYYENVS